MKKTILLTAVLAAAFAFTACGQTAESKELSEKSEAVSQISDISEKSSEEKEEIIEEDIEEIKRIGVKTEISFEVLLKNTTGKGIKELSVKLMEDELYPDNMLEKDDVFENDEARYLYYEEAKEEADKSNTGGEAASNVSSGEFELNKGYDLRLVFEDDSQAVLHAFPFGDIKEGELLFDEENGVAYIKYESTASGQTVETKEAEITIAENERAAEEARIAKEQAAAQAKAEAEAAAQAEAEERARAEAEAQAEAEERARAEAEAAARAAEEAARQEQQNQSNQSGCGDGFAFN